MSKELKKRLSSRKFLLSIVAALVAGLNYYFGWDLTVEQVWGIISPLIIYVGVEGVADAAERFGK